MTILTGRQIEDAALDGWANLLGGLQTRIETGSFAVGLALVAAIGAAAEEQDHHPDLDLRYRHLDVRLTSHDEHGVTSRDLRLARTIDRLAAEAGVPGSRNAVSRVELALDSPDFGSVLPFWGAVLAVEPPADRDAGGPQDELRDRFGALPTVWFQPSDSAEPRQRWHLDVWVDPAEIQGRIDAALAAGGRLVDDAEAPAFWVLADAEDNRVCLCTWQDRD